MIIKKSFCLGGVPLVRLRQPADGCLTQQGVGIKGEGNKALIGELRMTHKGVGNQA